MIFEIYTPKTPCQPLEASFYPIFVNCLLYVSIVNKSRQIIYHIDLNKCYFRNLHPKITACQPLEASFKPIFVYCLHYVSIVNKSKQIIYHIDLKI